MTYMSFVNATVDAGSWCLLWVITHNPLTLPTGTVC